MLYGMEFNTWITISMALGLVGAALALGAVASIWPLKTKIERVKHRLASQRGRSHRRVWVLVASTTT